MKDWFYDEFKQVGVDYSSADNTQNYDKQMDFRNYEDEVKTFIEKLSVDTNDLKAIDLGCGTGAFSLSAAKYFKKVYAVDVSETMLEIASSKAEGLNNIEFIHSGFLNFKLNEDVDVIFSKWAFHHLPDFWKQAALLNMNKMLKRGGVLFLSDVVFQFDLNYEENMDVILDNLSKDFDENFVEETKIHIRDEYSTFDWILRGLIGRAGFEIEHFNIEDTLVSEYFCRKVKSF